MTTEQQPSGSSRQGAPAPYVPVPERPGFDRYLEDTIVVDWQTPIVFEKTRALTAGLTSVEDRLRALFEFVRDEIDHSFDIETDELTCNASQVLRAGHGLCYAKCHLLAAMIRGCGVPAGFGFQRLRSEGEGSRFVLHGFVGVYLADRERWAALDARGNNAEVTTEFSLDAPSFAYTPDPALGEETQPLVYSKPVKHIVGMLSRAGSLERARRTLPDSV
jgi:transglutaminase-like putative cysteine protease